jgi:hypothetical protein
MISYLHGRIYVSGPQNIVKLLPTDKLIYSVCIDIFLFRFRFVLLHFALHGLFRMFSSL